MDVWEIKKNDINYLHDLLLDETGKLRIVPASELIDVPQEHLSQFCVEQGFYCLPTVELIDFLRGHIAGMEANTLEIGAGNGLICKTLGIKGTDSYMQTRPDIKLIYQMTQQATVPYGSHVEKFDALPAIQKYKPDIVIAAWVTHRYEASEHWRGGNIYGVDEKKVLRKTTKYIHIGNHRVHGKKPILSKEVPEMVHADWLFSRSMDRPSNIIYIWEKEVIK